MTDDLALAAPSFDRPASLLPPFPLATVEAWESELAELSAHLEHATWRQLTLIRQLEPTMLWAIHGATSYAVWLSWRIGLAPHAAREKIRVARALARLPRIDGAFSEGGSRSRWCAR